MLKGISDIITAVGKNPRKMWTMVIILIFVSAVTLTNTFLSTDDCSSLVKQNSDLVKAQGDLVSENQNILTNNRKLLDGYLELQRLLSTLKPDTVYVTKTISSELSRKDLNTLVRINTLYSDNDTTPRVNHMIRLDMLPKKITVTKNYKEVNEPLISKLNSLIASTIKDCSSKKK